MRTYDFSPLYRATVGFDRVTEEVTAPGKGFVEGPVARFNMRGAVDVGGSAHLRGDRLEGNPVHMQTVFTNFDAKLCRGATDREVVGSAVSVQGTGGCVCHGVEVHRRCTGVNARWLGGR